MFFFSFQLVIGDFGLNHEQSKAQFGLWSILAAVSVSLLKIERKFKPMKFSYNSL